jgi:predicted DNA-binding transcriptional regulator YafY
MPIQRYANRICRLDQLIRLKCTGSPDELAGKIGISKRMLFEYINDMKDLGAPISYCSFIRSYHYNGNGEFFIGFKNFL